MRWTLEYARWAFALNVGVRNPRSSAYAVGSGHVACEAVPIPKRVLQRAYTTRNAEVV